MKKTMAFRFNKKLANRNISKKISSCRSRKKNLLGGYAVLFYKFFPLPNKKYHLVSEFLKREATVE